MKALRWQRKVTDANLEMLRDMGLGADNIRSWNSQAVGGDKDKEVATETRPCEGPRDGKDWVQMVCETSSQSLVSHGHRDFQEQLPGRDEREAMRSVLHTAATTTPWPQLFYFSSQPWLKALLQSIHRSDGQGRVWPLVLASGSVLSRPCGPDRRMGPRAR